MMKMVGCDITITDAKLGYYDSDDHDMLIEGEKSDETSDDTNESGIISVYNFNFCIFSILCTITMFVNLF